VWIRLKSLESLLGAGILSLSSEDRRDLRSGCEALHTRYLAITPLVDSIILLRFMVELNITCGTRKKG